MDTPRGWIFDLKRFAVHDGPGIRSTVFFQGCPLRCPWCHNPESMARVISHRPVPPGARAVTAAELTDQLARDWICYEESGGGVTFSGGEPLLQPRFLATLLAACRERGLHTVLDTCGHAPPRRAQHLMGMADLVLFDVKILCPRRHHRICGVDTARIQANLQGLLDRGAPRLWLRFPFIPGYTDDPENLAALEELVTRRAGRIERVSLLPFHPAAAHKYRRLNRENPMAGAPAPDTGVAALRDRLAAVHPQVFIGG